MQPANPQLIFHIEIDDITDEEYPFPFLADGETHNPPPPTISCIDFFAKPGRVEPIDSLAHDFLITPEYIRFRAGVFVDAAEVVNSLRPGGALRKRLAQVDNALRRDSDLVRACEQVAEFLRSISSIS
jgi:hypothetical protein